MKCSPAASSSVGRHFRIRWPRFSPTLPTLRNYPLEFRGACERCWRAAWSATRISACPKSPRCANPCDPPNPRTCRPARQFASVAAAGIVLLAVVGILIWQKRPPAAPAGTHSLSPLSTQSVAVMPFVNQSGNPDDEYFSDGVTDELASALMKVPGLRVAAHSSTFTFKGKPTDVREVGAKLRVSSVLEGTVRRAGSRLRVNAELVNTADGLALWSDRFEREAQDLFQVQDDITGAIVSALRLKLGADAASGPSRRPGNAEAFDLYERGRFFMYKENEDGLRRSLDYFQQALAKDPNYAPAYAGISHAWSFLADARSWR